MLAQEGERALPGTLGDLGAERLRAGVVHEGVPRTYLDHDLGGRIRLGQPLAKIALCLDHRRQHDDDGVRLSAVTLKHYVHAHEIDLREKLETLTALEGWLLKVIGDSGASPDMEKLRLAA